METIRRLGISAYYNPWDKTRFSKSGSIIVDSEVMEKVFVYTIERSHTLETDEEFIIRSQNFQNTIKELRSK